MFKSRVDTKWAVRVEPLAQARRGLVDQCELKANGNLGLVFVSE